MAIPLHVDKMRLKMVTFASDARLEEGEGLSRSSSDPGENPLPSRGGERRTPPTLPPFSPLLPSPLPPSSFRCRFLDCCSAKRNAGARRWGCSEYSSSDSVPGDLHPDTLSQWTVTSDLAVGGLPAMPAPLFWAPLLPTQALDVSRSGKFPGRSDKAPLPLPPAVRPATSFLTLTGHACDCPLPFSLQSGANSSATPTFFSALFLPEEGVVCVRCDLRNSEADFSGWIPATKNIIVTWTIVITCTTLRHAHVYNMDHGRS